MYDYANILFTGRCNLSCYACIGNDPSLRMLPKNIDVFPPKNIDMLIDVCNKDRINDVAFTGTNVDPQIYGYEKELIYYMRERLEYGANLSLHTNGILALRKIDTVNAYDKVSISFPSFNREKYAKIAGKDLQPDIQKIVKNVKVPLKLSLLITPYNIDDTLYYMERAADLGIRRVVVRKIKGIEKDFPIENMEPFKDKPVLKNVFGWPVYDVLGIEATICDFERSTAKGIFLFSDGRIKDGLVD